MRRVKRVLKTTARKFERGSALLVTLMVLVGMSLLGLGFVALSETESAISVNERNHAQTVALAEAGAREVVQWFQYPDTYGASGLGFLPANSTTIKTSRTLTGGYTGFYRPLGTLFDLPFGPAPADMFYGTEKSADVKITMQNSPVYLRNLNNSLLGTESTSEARSTGEITEIRVFAPPIVGGNVVTDTNGQTFFDGGTRYGVATIAVRVDKFNKPSTQADRVSIANATCRIVVSQFPLPVPAGPLQSQTALATNGNFNVNWGLVSSQQTLNLQKDYRTLPWVNAYERLHYERGWDSSMQWVASTPFRVGDIIRPSDATLTANPLLKFHEYTVTVAGTTGATEPPSVGVGAWPTGQGATVTNGTVTMQERAPSAYPLTSGGGLGDTNVPWLYYLNSGLTIEDPWFQARSAGNITGDPAGPQPYPFPYNAPTTYGNTHHFQGQSFDQYSAYRRLIFPDINYDVWKAAAMAANGQGQVHYLYPANGTGPDFSDGITTQSFTAWTDSGAGFYFFDTLNQQNPQNGGAGDISLQISPSGGTGNLRGFIYINASLGTKGLSGITGNFNQPGEPYEDVGYRRVALTAVPPSTPVGGFETDAAGQWVIDGAYNKQWDFEDLPWSNSGNSSGSGTPNQYFDVCMVQRTVDNPATATSYAGWFVAPYYPGCKPGNNQELATCNCSEPHEPYLNIIYDGVNKLNLRIGFEDPASQTRIAKQTNPKDGPRSSPRANCTADYATTPTSLCTSNAYDREGGLVTLTDIAADGVLYIENIFDSTGNAQYYGSVLVGQGGVDSKGTPQIWYDESLQRGDWRPPGIPRVLVTSVETDQ